MSAIAQYVQVHLAGAGAGIDLFGHAADSLEDRAQRREIRRIRGELLDERKRLRRIARDLGPGESTLFTTAARAGGLASRIKPVLLWRSHMTDLIQLETMRDAVAGKIAGWQALLAVVDQYEALDRDELTMLLRQAEEQHDYLTSAHAAVAADTLSNR